MLYNKNVSSKILSCYLSIFTALLIMIPTDSSCGEFTVGFNLVFMTRAGMTIGYSFSEDYALEASLFGMPEGLMITSLNIKMYPYNDRTYILGGLALVGESNAPLSRGGKVDLGINTCIGQEIAFKDPTWRALAELGLFTGLTVYDEQPLLDEDIEDVFKDGKPLMIKQKRKDSPFIWPIIGIGANYSKNRR